MLGIRLNINDVKPTSDGMWSVSKSVGGELIKFSGPDRDQVFEQAQSHFNRVLSYHNKRRSSLPTSTEPKLSNVPT